MHNVNYRIEQNNYRKSRQYGNKRTFEQPWCGTQYARPKPASENATPELLEGRPRLLKQPCI